MNESHFNSNWVNFLGVLASNALNDPRVVTISARLERADSQRANMGKRAENSLSNSLVRARVVKLAFASAIAVNGG